MAVVPQARTPSLFAAPAAVAVFLAASLVSMAAAADILIAGGYFHTAGGVPTSKIASWDGTAWSPIGAGLSENVFALAVFQDELIVGTYASPLDPDGLPGGPGIFRWDRRVQAWFVLGGGANHTVVALHTHQNALYACGPFTEVGGQPIKYIAMWDGTRWFALGAGLETFDGYPYAMVSYGDKLVVAGNFKTPFMNIAQWDGVAWSYFGASPPDYGPRTLAIYRGSIAAGGVFGVGIYNGTEFTEITGKDNFFAQALLEAPDGNLVVGGSELMNLAHWNGSTWRAYGGDVDEEVEALVTYRGAIIVGGLFSEVGGTLAAGCIASIDPTTEVWSALGTGIVGDLFMCVRTLLVVSDAVLF